MVCSLSSSISSISGFVRYSPFSVVSLLLFSLVVCDIAALLILLYDTFHWGCVPTNLLSTRLLRRVSVAECGVPRSAIQKSVAIDRVFFFLQMSAFYRRLSFW